MNLFHGHVSVNLYTGITLFVPDIDRQRIFALIDLFIQPSGAIGRNAFYSH